MSKAPQRGSVFDRLRADQEDEEIGLEGLFADAGVVALSGGKVIAVEEDDVAVLLKADGNRIRDRTPLRGVRHEYPHAREGVSWPPLIAPPVRDVNRN